MQSGGRYSALLLFSEVGGVVDGHDFVVLTERDPAALALSLLPRGLPSGPSSLGLFFDLMLRSSWDRAKKSSSASYGDEPVFI
jgi:hypothetical protein